MRAQLLTGHISKENNVVIMLLKSNQSNNKLSYFGTVMTVTHFILSYPHNFNCRVQEICCVLFSHISCVSLAF